MLRKVMGMNETINLETLCELAPADKVSNDELTKRLAKEGFKVSEADKSCEKYYIKRDDKTTEFIFPEGIGKIYPDGTLHFDMPKEKVRDFMEGVKKVNKGYDDSIERIVFGGGHIVSAAFLATTFGIIGSMASAIYADYNWADPALAGLIGGIGSAIVGGAVGAMAPYYIANKSFKEGWGGIYNILVREVKPHCIGDSFKPYDFKVIEGALK